ncbi:uncharacterized protein LOC127449131 isoform X1 [Myxocyprinus asiaticus]|uniref:uncharacterized protein LOC127449131 isoform X1 n=1 Tax=Myxocyprinus asiaticus TaxID=70543 RepID=UPI002223C218|nr:uncharacterized protein LOC127449131 isoform X1 [Myxocyprinus asiaticus]
MCFMCPALTLRRTVIGPSTDSPLRQSGSSPVAVARRIGDVISRQWLWSLGHGRECVGVDGRLVECSSHYRKQEQPFKANLERTRIRNRQSQERTLLYVSQVILLQVQVCGP